MASTGDKLLLTGLALGAVGYFSYGKLWQETHDDRGNINGVEIIHDNQADAASIDPTNSIVVIDPSNKTQIKQALIQKAMQDPWCSSAELAVKAEDILLNSNEDSKIAEQSGAITNVKVCLDPETIEVKDGYIMAFFGTTPKLQTGEGRPSLYLTYNQDVLLPQCKQMKEDMRSPLVQDLQEVLGAAAASWQTEIHVNKDHMGHPCDDSFIEP